MFPLQLPSAIYAAEGQHHSAVKDIHQTKWVFS
jgi:hypothetical protein